MKDKIIVDIDGTICEIGERIKYLLEKPIDWEAFYNSSFDDKPVFSIIELLEEWFMNGYKIVFCTGRSNRVREKTVVWLKKYFSEALLEDSVLLMRSNTDHRPDGKVKADLIAKEGIDLDSVAFVLEDRKCCVDMYRKKKVLVFQVADGNF